MKGFMEQMVARGDSHMIYLFAATSPSDRTGEYGSTKLFRGFLSWRAGVHLGGDTDHQQVFDFELPMLERAKKLPAGMGHMVMDAETKKIVTAIG